MATEQRLFNDLDAQSTLSWTNESNAFVLDDNCAVTASALNLGQIAGGDFQSITQTPTGLSSFTVRFYDSASAHSDDTVLAQIYDLDSTSWITVETFNSGNLLPSSLTTKNYITTALTYYNAAADKGAWLDAFAFRLYCSAKIGGQDGIYISYAWAQFTYTYTETMQSFAPTIGENLSPQTVTASGDGSGSKSPTTQSTAVIQPSAGGQGSVNAGPMTAQFSVKQPTASGSAIVSVSPIVAQQAVQAPEAYMPGAGVSVSPISTVFTIRQPTASGNGAGSVSPISMSQALRTPVSSGAGASSLTPIVSSLSVRTPSAGGAGIASVSPIVLQLSVKSPEAYMPGTAVNVSPIGVTYYVVQPTAQGFVLIPKSETEITALVGVNQIVIIAGPIELNAGDRIQGLLKVATPGANIKWLQDRTLISIYKV